MASCPPKQAASPGGSSQQLRKPHALTMPLHNKPSTSTSSVVAFPIGNRGFVISLWGTRDLVELPAPRSPPWDPVAAPRRDTALT